MTLLLVMPVLLMFVVFVVVVGLTVSVLPESVHVYVQELLVVVELF